MKNSKVTVDMGMLASLIAQAVATAIAQQTTIAPVVTPVKGKKTAKQFSDALGMNVTKKWVTLSPVTVKNITAEERTIQSAAFKAAMAQGVGYLQANYAGYHAVKNSR